MILGCIAFDTVKNPGCTRRSRPGSRSLIVAQIGRLALSQTSQWMTFAKWVTS